MKKRLLMMALSMLGMVILCMLPGRMVLAEDDLSVTVGKAKLTATSPYTVDGVNATATHSGDSYAEFDGINTLTLHNFDLTEYTEDSGDYQFICSQSVTDAKIILVGDNSVTMPVHDGGNLGMYFYGGLTISGSGSLTVTIGDTVNKNSDGIQTYGDLIIDSGTVKVRYSGSNGTGLIHGMYAQHGNLIIKGGEIDVAVSKPSYDEKTFAVLSDQGQGIELLNGLLIKEPVGGSIGTPSGMTNTITVLDNNKIAHTVKISLPDKISLPYKAVEVSSSSSSSCNHDYQWTVEKEPTETEDGEAAYKCTKCGHISARQPLTAYQYYVLESTNKIKNAKAGSTVTISSKLWNSFPKSFFEQLAKRHDITVNIQFPCAQKMYEITISPTQTIDISNDKAKYYGPKYMIGTYNGTEMTAK